VESLALAPIGSAVAVRAAGWITRVLVSLVPASVSASGCLPPGQAKKRYRIGERLRDQMIFEEPPRELVARLRPCPEGYRYVVVDGDLVKLAIGTLLVVDVIDGLVD
jgi:hypothetical protein